MLHILRSEPDEATLELIDAMPHGDQASVIRLYETEADWDQVIEHIFGHKKIICWW